MKTVFSAFVIIACSLVLAGCSIPSAANIIIGDDFNRADSFTVGNSWTDSEPGDSGTVSSVSIIGNKLVCQGGLLGGSIVFGNAYRGNLSFSSHKTTAEFTMESNSYFAAQLYNSQTPGMNYYQVQISGGAIGLYKFVNGIGSSLGSRSFTFNTTHSYRLIASYSNNNFTLNLIDLSSSATTTFSVTDSTYQLFGLFCIGGGGYTGGVAYKTYIDSVVVEGL